jgi:hypothetical protein
MQGKQGLPPTPPLPGGFLEVPRGMKFARNRSGRNLQATGLTGKILESREFDDATELHRVTAVAWSDIRTFLPSGDSRPAGLQDFQDALIMRRGGIILGKWKWLGWRELGDPPLDRKMPNS